MNRQCALRLTTNHSYTINPFGDHILQNSPCIPIAQGNYTTDDNGQRKKTDATETDSVFGYRQPSHPAWRVKMLRYFG